MTSKSNNISLPVFLRPLRKGLLPLVVAACLVPPACNKAVVNPEPVADTGAALEFCGGFGAGMTKGAGQVTSESLRERHFGLFAYWEQQEDYFDGAEPGRLWLDDREVVYSETDGGVDYWRCSPAAYWPLGGCSLTFFAYAPYMDTRSGALRFPLYDDGPMPRGRFTQEEDVDSHIDLCLSYPVYDVKKNIGAVPVSFNHALTKVFFYFNLGGGRYEDDDRSFMVKSMSLVNVVGENSFTFGGQTGFRWDELPRSDLSSRDHTYRFSIADGTLSEIPLPYAMEREDRTGLAKYECVNGEEEGIPYLLPQPMTGESYISVLISLYSYDDATDTWTEEPHSEMDPVIIPLPEYTVWEPARTVCYSATIVPGISVSFNVTLADWDGNVIENVGFPVE